MNCAVISGAAVAVGALLLVVTIAVILANTYVGFQIWLRNMIKWYHVPEWLRKLHKPIQVGPRIVLLAFAAFVLTCISAVVFPTWMLYHDSKLSAILFLVSLGVGCVAAFGRYKSMKNS